MDNEINLFDMLLAKKLGGGGGAPIEKIEFTATGWHELPYIDISQFFPTALPDVPFAFALGILKFTFNALDVTIPIMVANLVAYEEISGGICNSAGVGAVVAIDYDNTDEVWSVAKALTNMMGTWIDITSDVQTDASDIVLTLFK